MDNESSDMYIYFVLNGSLLYVTVASSVDWVYRELGWLKLPSDAVVLGRVKGTVDHVSAVRKVCRIHLPDKKYVAYDDKTRGLVESWLSTGKVPVVIQKAYDALTQVVLPPWCYACGRSRSVKDGRCRRCQGVRVSR